MFLASVFVTCLIGTVLTAHPATFSLNEPRIGILEERKEINPGPKTPFPPVWFVAFPFQNAPGPLSNEADTQDLNPYGNPDTHQPREAHQSGIRFDRCLDTDLCVFIITEKNNQQKRRVMIELFGTDVPHLRQSCQQEKILATDAMEFLQRVLSNASQIDVYDHYKVGAKHMARVVVDGQDLSELLISQGLAAPKGHGSPDWCTK